MSVVPEFTFRLLAHADMPLLQAWQAQPHVARWWFEDVWTDEQAAEYAGSIDGTEPFESHLALVDGEPLGFILRYRLDAYDEELRELRALADAPADSITIDYLIGDKESCGKGLGAQMIRAFVAASWDAYPDAPCIIVPIHADNRPSWRTLEKVGFERIARGPLKPDNPKDSTDHVVYRLERPLS